MPILPEEPLTKVTLNLFTSDVEELKKTSGYGYTTKIRELVRQYCKTSRSHRETRERLHLKWPTQSTS
jgi:hypothetical protein